MHAFWIADIFLPLRDNASAGSEEMKFSAYTWPMLNGISGSEAESTAILCTAAQGQVKSLPERDRIQLVGSWIPRNKLHVEWDMS